MSQEQKFQLPYTLKLQHPVAFGKDETIDELVFERRMQAGDLMGISTQDIRFDDMLKLIGRMTARPPVIIKQLDATDAFAAMEVVNSFLPGGLTTE